MKVFEKIADIQNFVNEAKAKNLKIGFVPTMGALHEGHLSLIRESNLHNDITVASIFVNPIQFNDKTDFEKYPRLVDADIEMLEKEGCNAVFIPSVEEMYPTPDTRTYEFGLLDKVMEGKYRPGHFHGVAVVVRRLFEIVMPHNSYFGEKDFQQLQIIKSLVAQTDLPVNVVGCPIVRESDGLAMSSRNMRLSPELRKIAVQISATLFKAKDMRQHASLEEVKSFVINTINAVEEMQVEYFEMADESTLAPVGDWEDAENIIGCIVVFIGGVRLIDNIRFGN